MKFSSSLLKSWSNCQLQAFFNSEYGRQGDQHAKTTFGTIIHYCLEKFNLDGDLQLAKDRFAFFWDNPEELQKGLTPTTFRGTSYGALRERGPKILDHYAGTLKWEPREVVAVEHKFCVPFGDHTVSGIVDLVEFKASGGGIPILKIVDYKTTSKQPTLAELRLDIQFTIYMYASMQPEFWMGYTEAGWHPPMVDKYPPMENGEKLYERFKDVPRRAAWYHLWGSKELDAGDRTDNDFLRLYALLEGVAKAVDHEVFIPSINANSCNWCDFKDICPAVAPVLDKIDLVTGGIGDDTFF